MYVDTHIDSTQLISIIFIDLKCMYMYDYVRNVYKFCYYKCVALFLLYANTCTLYKIINSLETRARNVMCGDHNYRNVNVYVLQQIQDLVYLRRFFCFLLRT